VIIEFGGDCLFSCEARCSRPIVYQWLKDGVPMEGKWSNEKQKIPHCQNSFKITS
jgi:hypothetical protein